MRHTENRLTKTKTACNQPDAGNWLNNNAMASVSLKENTAFYYRLYPFERKSSYEAIIKQRILLPMNSASRSYSRTAMRMLMAYIPALLSVKMGRSTSFIQEM